MNKLKLQAKLIDIGVVEEDDVVVIKQSGSNVYITVVNGLNSVASYIFQNNELVIVEGNSIHINDILRMRELDLIEFGMEEIE